MDCQLTIQILDVLVAERSTLVKTSPDSGVYLNDTSSNCRMDPASGSVSGNLEGK